MTNRIDELPTWETGFTTLALTMLSLFGAHHAPICEDARAGDEAIYTPQAPYYVFNECDFYADSDQMSETAQVNLIESFARKLLERSEAHNQEAAKILNRRFWDLV